MYMFYLKLLYLCFICNVNEMLHIQMFAKPRFIITMALPCIADSFAPCIGPFPGVLHMSACKLYIDSSVREI